MSLFAFQRPLDKSTEVTLSFLTDCVRAATQDDVQVSAIVACENFGTTLAISPDTRRKLETVFDAKSDTTIVKFLKCRIGYTGNETLHLFRQSIGGVNFLALIAALLGSMDNFTAALALERMMSESLPRKNGNLPLPTAYQLTRLIDVLEPKLVLVKFNEDVIRWKNRCTGDIRVPNAIRKELQDDGASLPTTESIQHIVNAFRKLARIGDAAADRVVITASACAPWIAAFSTWCLGVSPKVGIAEGNFLVGESSPVTLILSDGDGGPEVVEVRTLYTKDSYTDVLRAGIQESRDPLRSVGMISMAVHSSELLQELGFQRGIEAEEPLAYRAVKYTLPIALYQVRELCCVGVYSSHRVLNPFPNGRRIATVAKKYLGLDEAFELQNPGPGYSIKDSPLVRSWASAESAAPPPAIQPIDLFPTKLARLVANIMALSLFHWSFDDILLWSGPWNETMNEPLSSMIREILVTGKPKACSMVTILDWALNLVRHDVTNVLNSSQWLGSCFKGQVVFPKIFEHHDVLDEGWLELYCIPGVLVTESKRVHRRISALKETSVWKCDLDVDEEPVKEVVNFFGSDTITWVVEEQEDHLGVALGWSGGNDLFCPFEALLALGRTSVISCCNHERQTPSQYEEADAYYQAPTDESLRANEGGNNDKIAIFPISGSPELRLLALSSIAWRIHQNDPRNPLVLLNKGSCLACALIECRKQNCKYLLL